VAAAVGEARAACGHERRAGWLLGLRELMGRPAAAMCGPTKLGGRVWADHSAAREAGLASGLSRLLLLFPFSVFFFFFFILNSNLV